MPPAKKGESSKSRRRKKPKRYGNTLKSNLVQRNKEYIDTAKQRYEPFLKTRETVRLPRSEY